MALSLSRPSADGAVVVNQSLQVLGEKLASMSRPFDEGQAATKWID